MHTGRFSALPAREPPSYARGAWSPAELDPPAPTIGRRQLLLGAGCLALGAALPTSIGLAAGRGRSPAGAPEAPEIGVGDPALPEWSAEMLRVSRAELLRRAGEYEMSSRRHSGDRRLAPGFERLLRVAATSSHPQRDLAAACAVRSLAHLGRIDLVETWLPRLEKNASFPVSTRAGREELDQAALERRSRQR